MKKFYAYILLALFSGVIIVPISNKAIAELAVDTPLLQSPKVAQVSDSDEDQATQLAKAKEVAQGFFDSLVAGEFEQAREYLNPSVKEYFSAADLEQQWQRILEINGSFEEYKKIRSTKLFDQYYVLVTSNFENLITDFTVTLDSNQQIVTIDSLLIGDIQASAEEFIDALSTGKYGVARGYLTPDLKQTFLPENLEQRWQEIIATAGLFKNRTSSRVIESSSSDAVLVDLEFAKENRSFLIVFNPLGQIVGVEFPQSPE